MEVLAWELNDADSIYSIAAAHFFNRCECALKPRPKAPANPREKGSTAEQSKDKCVPKCNLGTRGVELILRQAQDDGRLRRPEVDGYRLRLPRVGLLQRGDVEFDHPQHHLHSAVGLHAIVVAEEVA
jgi:hypothetical protein